MTATRFQQSSMDDPAGNAEMKVLVVVLDATTPADVPDAEVLVIAPALNSRLRHWLSDEDAARRRAAERAAALVDRLERRGVRAQGRVGDADPLLAIVDALRTFAADEVIVVGRPERSNGLADKLVTRARGRLAVPILQAAESPPRAALASSVCY